MLVDFISYVEQRVGRVVYVWRGNGETLYSPLQVEKMETSARNVERVLTFWRKFNDCQPVEMYDCSGLAIGALRSMGLMSPKADAKANTLMAWSRRIPLDKVTVGCWVFRVNSTGAYHIGYCTDVINDKPIIVEVFGRDHGCVKRPIDAKKGYWTHAGVPKFFEDEIAVDEPEYSRPVLSRTLKLDTPMQSGEDVKILQATLNELGFQCGSVDGKFGAQTLAGVLEFQGKFPETGTGGKPDGKVGNKTWNFMFALLERENEINDDCDVVEPKPEVCPYKRPTALYRAGSRIVGNDAAWVIFHLRRLGYKNLLEGVNVVGKNCWAAIFDVQKKGLGRTGDMWTKTYDLLEKP